MSAGSDPSEPIAKHSVVERPIDEGGEDEPGVVQSLEAFMALGRSGRTYHPIFEKFESEHVSQFLDHARDRERDENDAKRSVRWFRLAYTLTGVALFVFLTVLLMPEQSDLYFKLLQGVGLFVAGLAGGYGLKTYRDRDRE